MARLARNKLDEVIRDLQQPVLGICLGMQLLHAHSAEGDVACLAILPGSAARFAPVPERPVPHMGWNTLTPVASDALLQGVTAGAYAYFVHSYALPVIAATTATAEYGAPFSACVQHRNFHGVQFHPERSALTGARVLRNFLEMN